MKILKSNKGFSLVELMIVVAIIGILSSVAIPNFQRFQRKARQSESTSLLAAYHSAQKATYAEWSFYPGNFSSTGFNPDGQLTYRIIAADNITGATAAPGGGAIPGYLDTCVDTASTTVCPVGYPSWSERTAGVASGLAGPAGNTAACVPAADGSTFKVCSSAYLGSGVADEWSLDHNKVLENEVSGL